MKDFIVLVVATVLVSHYMGPSDNLVVIRSSLVKDDRMHTPPTAQNNSELRKSVTAAIQPATRKDTDPAHLSVRGVTSPMEGGGKKETERPTTTPRPDTPPAHFQQVTASSRSTKGAGHHIHSKPVAYCSRPPTENRTPGRFGNGLSTHPPRGGREQYATGGRTPGRFKNDVSTHPPQGKAIQA
ncbi:unnamed protein product [Caenorhabditis nigoni]